MTLTLAHYLLLATLLFAIGVYGMLTRRNAVALLLTVELMMLAVALNFTACGHFLGMASGQIFAIFVITIAAVEVTVGLALVIAIYRNQKDVDLDRVTWLKG